MVENNNTNHCDQKKIWYKQKLYEDENEHIILMEKPKVD